MGLIIIFCIVVFVYVVILIGYTLKVHIILKFNHIQACVYNKLYALYYLYMPFVCFEYYIKKNLKGIKYL